MIKVDACPSEQFKFYTVKQGDSYSKLAKEHGISLEQLQDSNQGYLASIPEKHRHKGWDYLETGKVIRIPRIFAPTPAKITPIPHKNEINSKPVAVKRTLAPTRKNSAHHMSEQRITGSAQAVQPDRICYKNQQPTLRVQQALEKAAENLELYDLKANSGRRSMAKQVDLFEKGETEVLLSAHICGSAIDLDNLPADVSFAAFEKAAKAQGFEVYDEGDHIHLEFQPTPEELHYARMELEQFLSQSRKYKSVALKLEKHKNRLSDLQYANRAAAEMRKVNSGWVMASR